MTRYVVIAGTCLALAGVATTPSAAQEPARVERLQKSPEGSPERPLPAPAAVGQTAFETREQLQRLLRHYPPAVSSILRIDPALLSNTQYLSMYPALASFLAQHAEIAHNWT